MRSRALTAAPPLRPSGAPSPYPSPSRCSSNAHTPAPVSTRMLTPIWRGFLTRSTLAAAHVRHSATLVRESSSGSTASNHGSSDNHKPQRTRVIVVGVDPDTHGSLVVASWTSEQPRTEPVDLAALDSFHIYDVPCALVTLNRKNAASGKFATRRWVDVFAARQLVQQILLHFNVHPDDLFQSYPPLPSDSLPPSSSFSSSSSVSCPQSKGSISSNGSLHDFHAALDLEPELIWPGKIGASSNGNRSQVEAFHHATQIKEEVERGIFAGLEEGGRTRTELRAYIETSPIMPFQSRPATVASQMYAVGAWHGILSMAGFHACTVSASRWKRDLALTGFDKSASVSLAKHLFPAKAGLLTRKLDHGRAEAMLIAAWALGLSRKPDPQYLAMLSAQRKKRMKEKATDTSVQGRPHVEGEENSEEGLAPDPDAHLSWPVILGPLRQLAATDGYGNPFPILDTKEAVDELGDALKEAARLKQEKMVKKKPKKEKKKKSVHDTVPVSAPLNAGLEVSGTLMNQSLVEYLRRENKMKDGEGL